MLVIFILFFFNGYHGDMNINNESTFLTSLALSELRSWFSLTYQLYSQTDCLLELYFTSKNPTHHLLCTCKSHPHFTHNLLRRHVYMITNVLRCMELGLTNIMHKANKVKHQWSSITQNADCILSLLFIQNGEHQRKSILSSYLTIWQAAGFTETYFYFKLHIQA